MQDVEPKEGPGSKYVRNEKREPLTLDNKPKILVMKSYDKGEGQWEVNEVPAGMLDFLPTDSEYYLDTEVRFEYITQEEMDVMSLNSFRFMDGMSLSAAKNELAKHLTDEIDGLKARIAKIMEIVAADQEEREHEAEMEELEKED